MITSQEGIDLIKNFEGCRLKAYKCPAGIWTIGYGHTSGVKEGQVITLEQAEQFLRQDLKRFETSVRNLVTVPIKQNQFDALVSFAYNLGATALSTSTLLKKLNNSDYNGAALEFDRWVYANGNKLNGLIRRRAAEKELFTKNLKANRYKVVATALNVRSGTGTSYKIVKVLKQGEIVNVFDTLNGWAKISGGWVSMKYLSPV